MAFWPYINDGADTVHFMGAGLSQDTLKLLWGLVNAILMVSDVGREGCDDVKEKKKGTENRGSFLSTLLEEREDSSYVRN